MIAVASSERKTASLAETAKRVREDLKLAFPGAKFSVRSRRGSAIDIEYEDGPTTDRVKDIVDRYQYGDFDGMTDSYEYRAERVVVLGVEYSARWVQVQRHMSDAAMTRFMALIQQYRGDLAGKPDYEIQNLAYREFVKWDGLAAELPTTTDDLPSAREWRAS